MCYYRHISIKHEVLNKETNNQKINIISGAISDLFQIEIVDQVQACNVCNEKFDKEDKVKKKNIKFNHKNIPIKNSQHIKTVKLKTMKNSWQGLMMMET